MGVECQCVNPGLSQEHRGRFPALQGTDRCHKQAAFPPLFLHPQRSHARENPSSAEVGSFCEKNTDPHVQERIPSQGEEGAPTPPRQGHVKPQGPPWLRRPRWRWSGQNRAGLQPTGLSLNPGWTTENRPLFLLVKHFSCPPHPATPPLSTHCPSHTHTH